MLSRRQATAQVCGVEGVYGSTEGLPSGDPGMVSLRVDSALENPTLCPGSKSQQRIVRTAPAD